MLKLNAKQLRKSQPDSEELKGLRRHPIILILDNVSDTFNIGSFFRLADAVNAEKVYLCGKTILPPNIKIHRSSVGTWRWIPWEQRDSLVKLIKELKKKGYFVVAAEQSNNSKPFHKIDYKFPLALVCGHETTGVDPKALKEVDIVAELPLLGINKSLNVLVAASAILYYALAKIL